MRQSTWPSYSTHEPSRKRKAALPPGCAAPYPAPALHSYLGSPPVYRPYATAGRQEEGSLPVSPAAHTGQSSRLSKSFCSPRLRRPFPPRCSLHPLSAYRCDSYYALNQQREMLVLSIGLGVGLAAIIGTLRFVRGWSLKPIM